MASSQQSGAGAADGRAPADADSVVARLFSFAAACAAHRRTARDAAFDLIFVHCSSVAHYVENVARHTEDPRLRRHGLAEVARIRALQAVSAVARLPARRRQDGAREESGSRAASTCARRRRAPNGRRSKAIAPGLPRTGSRTASTANISRRAAKPYDADTICVRRPDGLLPEPGVHVRFLRADASRCCARAGPGSSS